MEAFWAGCIVSAIITVITLLWIRGILDLRRAKAFNRQFELYDRVRDFAEKIKERHGVEVVPAFHFGEDNEVIPFEVWSADFTSLNRYEIPKSIILSDDWDEQLSVIYPPVLIQEGEAN